MNYINTENKQNIMIKKKSQKKLSLNDDTLDYLDSEMDKYKDATNLGEKINIYSNLSDTIKYLINDVNGMINIIGDDNLASDTDEDNDEDNVISSILNIEGDINDLKINYNDNSIEKQIQQYKKIIKKINKCKHKYQNNKMKVNYCS